MGYTPVALKDKILQMHPLIEGRGISLSVTFSHLKDVWVVKMRKDGHELVTYLERSAADDCIDGRVCVHLGVQIDEFMRNFGNA